MEIRTVNGQQAVDRAGAAEYLGLALSTVRIFSSPAQRASTGFPAPLPDRDDRRDWFAIADLDVYRAAKASAVAAPPMDDDPEELIGVAEFAALRGVSPATIHGYVKRSLNDWQEHRDGYLPYPDEITAARRGHTYRWKRGRAIGWTFPDQPRTGGRTPGRAPTVADLESVLGEAGPAALKNRDIAAALSQRLGRPVSLQTVLRLKQKRAQQDDGTTDI
ncbi:hypothetical protein [Catenuloplanes japonicus]|uniref:hypothetical protein n=1 Tax=Catenuloplanes japonicus TaxID=33876 RepID=UPI000526B8CC|nr:hypothetical protein [Catenuloplanes japonicus]